MNSKTDDCTTVTKENLDRITGLLNNGLGRILIVGPGFQSYKERVVDVNMTLYDRPFIRNGFIGTERGSKKVRGQDWQTGWERDRLYLIRPIDKPTGDTAWDSARELFEALPVGKNYSLKIGFESVVCRTLFVERTTLLFIRRHRDPRNAFAQALGIAMGLLDEAFSEKNIAAMLDYILKDIQDGLVFTKNVGAGMEADAMTGT